MSDIKTYLEVFYEKNLNNDSLFSRESIINTKPYSLWSPLKITPYNLLLEEYEKGLGKNINDFKKKMLELNIVFGLKSGIIFCEEKLFIIEWEMKEFIEFSYSSYCQDISNLDPSSDLIFKDSLGMESRIQFNKLFRFETDIIKHTQNEIKQILDKIEEKKIEEENKREEERLKKLQISQNNILSELDKDGNGEVDVFEGNDFNLLLKKHQKNIVEVDRNYVQQFVKISSYLKTKEKNIQSIFNSIKNTPNQEVLNEYVEILKGDIYSYNLILFNSLNMIVSLVEDEMITFYEIHEQFDTLNMFDSKHEKDISQKLSNIGDGLENLIYEIRDMSDSINNSIGELSYVTKESNKQLEEQLSEINSSLGVNNLLTGIQTYQMYKINKNTKSLNG